MSLTARLVRKLTLTPTFSGTFVSSANNDITVNGLDDDTTLTASTTPAVSAWAANQKALSSGTATIDLTSLPGTTSFETVTGNGLKLVAVLFENPATNSGTITVAKGASTGYAGFGSAFSLTLQIGGAALVFTNGNGTAVSSSNKTLDLTGTGTEALSYTLIFG